jgi:hypothetical protein
MGSKPLSFTMGAGGPNTLLVRLAGTYAPHGGGQEFSMTGCLLQFTVRQWLGPSLLKAACPFEKGCHACVTSSVTCAIVSCGTSCCSWHDALHASHPRSHAVCCGCPQVVRGSVGGVGPGYEDTEMGEGSPSKTADLGGFTSQLANRDATGRSRSRNGSSSSAGGRGMASLAASWQQHALEGWAFSWRHHPLCMHVLVYARPGPDTSSCMGCRFHPHPRPDYGPAAGPGVSCLAGQLIKQPLPPEGSHHIHVDEDCPGG